MLTGGHIAASYLIGSAAESVGINLMTSDMIMLIIAGNISDIDFLVGLVTGKTGEEHHKNITHTPIGMLLLWSVIVFVFHVAYPMSLLIILVMFFHLFLDEIGYWAYKIKFVRSPVNSQINWFYPMTKYSSNTVDTDNRSVLHYYTKNTWQIFILEITLIVTALAILIWKNGG